MLKRGTVAGDFFSGSTPAARSTVHSGVFRQATSWPVAKAKQPHRPGQERWDGDGQEGRAASHALASSAFRGPTDAKGLLTSAWVSPDHAALSVINTNTNAAPLSVSLNVGGEKVRSARLMLSAFDGVERMSDLGEGAPGRHISLPARSIATLLIEE